ncbi:MAG: sugar phosphate isomerase/epimerase family protein [Thermoguttaceae bacterium]|nr:sugar phosphate isomerase/epimerase family protein [Thermoguttaceae bacterium]
MRFAICNETFVDWPLEKGFAFAAECGYAGVEIAPFTISRYVTDIPAAVRREIRREAAAVGLEIVGLHWLLAKTEGFHLTSPDPVVRRRTADYLRELVRFCADLGGRILVFGSPAQRSLPSGVSFDQGLVYAAEVFQSIVPELEKNGIVLAVEPLSPSETNFLCAAAEAMQLINMLRSPHVQLHLDCKAMASEKIPIEKLIRDHATVLAHFHANDPNRQGPGFGSLDFVPILRTLLEIKYQGWVSVEVFDYTPGPEALAKKSIEYLRVCLEKAREQEIENNSA